MKSRYPDLDMLVKEALDLGLGCFEEGDSAPFIILVANDEKKLLELQNAEGQINDALVDAGRDIVRQFAGAGQYYCLVWDGYLTLDGKRLDAAFVEAAAANESRACLFAQRYRQLKSGKLSKVGKRLAIGDVANLWSDASAVD